MPWSPESPAPGSTASIVRTFALGPVLSPLKPQLYGIQTVITSSPLILRTCMRLVTTALTVTSPRADVTCANSPCFTPILVASFSGISTTGSGTNSFSQGTLRVVEPQHQCSRHAGTHQNIWIFFAATNRMPRLIQARILHARIMRNRGVQSILRRALNRPRRTRGKVRRAAYRRHRAEAAPPADRGRYSRSPSSAQALPHSTGMASFHLASQDHPWRRDIGNIPSHPLFLSRSHQTSGRSLLSGCPFSSQEARL